MRRRKSIILGLIVMALVALTLSHNVRSNLTAEDREFVPLFLQNTSIIHADKLDYADQVNYISTLQRDVQDDVKLGEGIDYGSSREPKDLYREKEGICYDIGRTLEKAFLMSGLKTRHVSVYKKQEGRLPFIRTMIKQQIPSHSIQEVKTEKGWLVVDSNIPWLALDENNEPYSMKQISKANASNPIQWKSTFPEQYGQFYQDKIIVVYGLLSRHGQFYPPYSIIPDYNLRDLLHNL